VILADTEGFNRSV